MAESALINGNLINDDRPLAVEQQGAITIVDPVTIDGDVDIHVEGQAPQMDDADKLAVSVYGTDAAPGDITLNASAAGNLEVDVASPLPAGANNIGDVDVLTINGTAPTFDAATSALATTTYPHHEIHSGSAFAVHHYELDFDKASEIGVLFTTANTTRWVHVVALVGVGTKALFEILQAPTIDVANYPVAFYAPRNRNQNSATTSGVLSVRAAPVVNQVSLKRKADAAPITADGVCLHAEAFGAKKGKTMMSGIRDDEEYVLLQDTTYYFRILGNNTGDDDVAASMEITWYEHTNVA